MDAYKCVSCGDIVSDKKLHRCPNQKYQDVSLTSAEFCAKFGHQYVESEIPGTRQRYDRRTFVWEDEERLVDWEGWKVLRKCTICGEGYTFWKEHRL